MKKIITLLVAIFMVGSVFADGNKDSKANSEVSQTKLPYSITSTTYAPDPNSAGIRNAFNLYGGIGGALSAGIDWEFVAFDPNLTLGPQIIVDFPIGTARGLGMDISGAVIARYYADWLIPNMPDAFDVFITSNAGIEFNTNGGGAYTILSGAVGGRWNFSESMSLYAQLGAGFRSNILLVGLSWKM